ncbi:MAG: hypothetical protein ACFFDI_24040 [Promethearchaeota archaeon]
MDFPSLHQHIDSLLEQERCVDAQALIDEQLTHPRYSKLTVPARTHLSLWEEKWQLQLLTCKSLTIQFKPNEAVFLADKVLEESRLLEEFISKIQTMGMAAKVHPLLLLGHIQECQQLIKEVEGRLENLNTLSQAETTGIRAGLGTVKGYLSDVFGHPELALAQLQNSRKLLRQNGDNEWSVGVSLIIEGQVYIDAKQYSKGVELLQKCAEYNKSHGLKYNYAYSLIFLAYYLCQVGELVLAEEYGLRALKSSEERGSKLMVA